MNKYAIMKYEPLAVDDYLSRSKPEKNERLLRNTVYFTSVVMKELFPFLIYHNEVCNKASHKEREKKIEEELERAIQKLETMLKNKEYNFNTSSSAK